MYKQILYDKQMLQTNSYILYFKWPVYVVINKRVTSPLMPGILYKSN